MDIINIYDNSDKLYYIGGVVRDKLLGVKSFDVDITYVGDAIEYCAKFGEVIQGNPDFGTIRVNVGGREVDFASTRAEVYKKKGHLPVVTKIGCSLKEDVLRRDFTINALAMSVKTGEIIDYVGGQEDLKNKVLRVLHDKSFIDDPTRIIRGLKFRVRFGFDLEPNTRKLQEDYLAHINYDMSYKRVKKELIETFNLNSQYAFELFVKEGIYKLISPEKFDIPKVNIENLINKYPVKLPWIIYIGLLPDLSRIEFTKEEKKIIEDFRSIGELKDDFEIYKAFDGLALESIFLYAISKDMKSAFRYLDVLRNIKISITGDDLKNLGIAPSPKYQEIFDYVLKEKLKNPDITTQDEISLAKKFIN